MLGGIEQRPGPGHTPMPQLECPDRRLALRVARRGVAWAVAWRSMVTEFGCSQDPRFNSDVDMRTGYKTNLILSMPICNHDGEVIGVAQIINKTNGCNEFTTKDVEVGEGAVPIRVFWDSADLSNFAPFVAFHLFRYSKSILHSVASASRMLNFSKCPSKNSDEIR